MDSFFSIIKELQNARGIPQFLFLDGIYPATTSKARKAILDYKKRHPEVKEIDMILDSGGGSADDAYRIIRTLRFNFDTVNIVIPFWAKSAATLLALGGSTIIMDEFGEFGPLDTQLKDSELPDEEYRSALIDEHSLSTIEKRATALYRTMMRDIVQDKSIRIKKENLSSNVLTYITTLYKPLLEKIDPYEIGSKARALGVGEKYAERILVQFNGSFTTEDEERLDLFVDYIVHGCPDHGYIIDYSLISTFLNNVKLSKEISDVYAEKLTDLSVLLFESIIKERYVGFLEDIIPKEKKDRKKGKEQEVKDEEETK